MSAICLACRSQAVTVQCSACKVAAYCGSECQQRDWAEHHQYEHSHEAEHNQSIGDVIENHQELIEARSRTRGRSRGRGGGGGKKWIQKTHMKKGAFTKKAKKHNMTPAQFQRKVLANPDRYDTETVKQANLRKTLVGM